MVKVEFEAKFGPRWITEALSIEAVLRLIENTAERVFDKANSDANSKAKDEGFDYDFHYGIYVFDDGNFGPTAVIWPTSMAAKENPEILLNAGRSLTDGEV